VRAHHRQLLAIQLAHVDFLDEQIESLSAEVTRWYCQIKRVAWTISGQCGILTV